MAQGDIIILEQSSSQGGRGGRLYNVAAGTPIYAGEPVQLRALGNIVVEPALTNMFVVATDYCVGISSTNSTNTATAAGTVEVIPTNSNMTFLVNPDAPTSWDTQAEYDALVGKRVLMKNSVSVTATPTSGTYTLLASDGSTYSWVVQALDISRYPGKVAVALRAGTSNLA